MTDKPARIQRKRTKGWKMPKNTIYVGRPSKWGNPYRIGEEIEFIGRGIKKLQTSKDLVEMYKYYLSSMKDESPRRYKGTISELKGKNLACWCKISEECHADVLLAIATNHDHQSR